MVKVLKSNIVFSRFHQKHASMVSRPDWCWFMLSLIWSQPFINILFIVLTAATYMHLGCFMMRVCCVDNTLWNRAVNVVSQWKKSCEETKTFLGNHWHHIWIRDSLSDIAITNKKLAHYTIRLKYSTCTTTTHMNKSYKLNC